MRIGILGTRGIPNAYGGFEQFAQFLALGLTQKGHAVYVYNSSLHPYQEKKWNNIHIIHCKDAEDRIGTAGQFFYDLNCIKDARKRKFDILLQLGYTSNSIWFRRWPKDAINIINMDGLEWKRSKYGASTRRFLKLAEKWAARNGDILIADSLGIQQYLKKTYHKESVYIPYGANLFTPDEKTNLPDEWGVLPKQYFLVIARMEPENNIEMIIKGHLASNTNFPLLLTGNYNNKFGQYLYKSYKSDRIRFLGGIYDQDKINLLRYFSLQYFHGHSVGGTNPSLLEAMGCSCHIAAHDNIFNRAILGEDADYFQNEQDIAVILNSLHSSTDAARRIHNNRSKVNTLYNWENIVAQYEKVFLQAVAASQQNISTKPDEGYLLK